MLSYREAPTNGYIPLHDGAIQVFGAVVAIVPHMGFGEYLWEV